MEELMQHRIDKIGIDRATAEKVSESGIKARLPGGLGDKLGGLG